MVSLQPADLFNGTWGKCTQPRKQRLLFIRGVPLSAGAEVLKSSLHRIALFAGQVPALGARNHHTENAKEVLDSAMAVFEHAKRIIESAAGLRANLYRHVSTSLPRPTLIVAHSLSRMPSHPLEHMEAGCSLYLGSRLRVSLGNIGTARFFSVWVSAQRIGAGSRSATNLSEFAGPAFPFELRRIPQVPEYRRVPIDFGQSLLTNAAGRQRKKSAGKDLSDVGNENETFAVVETARRAPDGVGGLFLHNGSADPCLSLRDSLLQKEGSVVLR